MQKQESNSLPNQSSPLSRTYGEDVKLDQKSAPQFSELSKDPDENNQRFLVRWTALLTLLPFIVFLLTKDVAVFASSATIVGIAVCAVYRFYFSRKK